MADPGDLAFPDPQREPKAYIIGLPCSTAASWLTDAMNGATSAMRDYRAAMKPWVTKKNLRRLRRIDRRARRKAAK